MYDNPEEIKASICDQIAIGKGLGQVCAQHGMPSERTVYDWLSADEEFSQRYARAREQQADHYADEIIEIADTEADASKARNRIDARKWKASKLQPKKYGDKLDVGVDGTVIVKVMRFADNGNDPQ